MKKTYLYILCIVNVLISLNVILVALFIAYLVNKAVNHESIITYSYILLGLLLFQILLTLFKDIIKNKYSLLIENGLKKEIYNKYINKKISKSKDIHSGELSNMYLSDVKNISDCYTQTIPNFFLNVSKIIFAFIAFFIVDYKFLLILLIIGFFAFIFARIYGSKMKILHKKALYSDGKVNSYMQESAENIKLIKAMSAEENANSCLDDLLTDNYKIKKKRNYFSIIGTTGISSVMNISYILAVIYGCYFIYMGTITYGAFVALIQLVNHFESPIANLSGLINRYFLFKASKERINEIDKLDDEDESMILDDFDSIVFENLTFSYDRKIYDNFNFEIKKNDIIQICGRSGIGKTTLLNLLLGFIVPDSGRIYIKYNNNEYNINKSTRNLFSYVPQENILFSGTILDNIKIFNKNASIEEINNALKLACVYDDIYENELGLNRVLNERGNGLSIGQIQRILIAISLLNDKKILLLDEFTSALDFKKESQILLNIKSLNKTIIMISHRNLDINTKKIELEE